MKVVFRVDSSVSVGAGHIMRCLTLANELKNKGAHVTFLSRVLPGNLIDRIENHDFQVISLSEKVRGVGACSNDNALKKETEITQEEDACLSLNALKDQGTLADWLVVDHYALGARWEQIVSSCTKKIMVIDDLANRSHNCHILLDMTLKRSARAYLSYVPADCSQLLGSKYILLRPQFREMRNASLLKRNDKNPVNKILICLGGMDNENVTLRLLNIIEKTQLPVSVDVVLLSKAPHLKQVQLLAKTLTFPINIYVDVPKMEKIIAAADWGIVAGGMTSFECCCLGLPTSIINTAENQILVSENLVEMRAAHLLGFHNLISDDHIGEELIKVTKNGEYKNTVSLAASKVCDGKGVERVANKVVSLT